MIQGSFLLHYRQTSYYTFIGDRSHIFSWKMMKIRFWMKINVYLTVFLNHKNELSLITITADTYWTIWYHNWDKASDFCSYSVHFSWARTTFVAGAKGAHLRYEQCSWLAVKGLRKKKAIYPSFFFYKIIW